MIELQHVTKLYGTVIGVNDVTLTLESGAYGLIGPNGSGKTTLLNLITGQLRPTMGTVRVFGQPPWQRDRLLRMIGLCPSVDILYPNVTALDWVRYLVELYGFSRREARERSERALRDVGMAPFMERPMGTYSLGLRQRAKLAQAFAHDPTLLVLDEPFNGLDPVGRHDMAEVLRGWVRRGRSLMLASHVLHEVEAISQRFLLIRGGRVLASGPREEIHALLAEIPNEIRIRCDRAASLARACIGSGLAESVRLVDGGAGLVVATRSPTAVFEQLPRWLAELQIRADEVHSAEESLQRLFTLLTRRHRGELP